MILFGRYKGDYPDDNGSNKLCKHLAYDEVFINNEGGVRFCSNVASYIKKTVTNIYHKDFENYIQDLNTFHKANYGWLKENLPCIISGKSKSCLCSR